MIYTPVTIYGDKGPCEAYTRRLTRCPHNGHFDNYHFAVLCDVHADMDEPPMSAEAAQRQRQERDTRYWQDHYQTPANAEV